VTLFPEARCAVALGWSWTPGDSDAAAAQYLANVAAQAESAGFGLQLFVTGEVLAQPCEWLAGLSAAGHAVDLAIGGGRSLLGDDRDGARAELSRTIRLFREVLGQAPAGLRAVGGHSEGLLGRADLQQMILDVGLGFVSTVYATRAPAGEYDVFADRNACMIMKHQQPRRYPTGLLEIPMSGYSDRSFLDELGRPLAAWIQHLRSCLDFAYDMGGLLHAPALQADVHARHDPGCEVMLALLEHTGRKHEAVRFCTCREVAAASAENERASPGGRHGG
jgi:hypothetical protein